MAKDQVINVRVSVEEKATLKKAAGAGGIGPYLRALGLAQANGIGPRTSVSDPAASSAGYSADGGSEGRDSAANVAAKASGKPPVSYAGEAGSTPAAAMPASNWRARVRQLTAGGVPRPAAERIADLEFRG